MSHKIKVSQKKKATNIGYIKKLQYNNLVNFILYQNLIFLIVALRQKSDEYIQSHLLVQR